MPLTISGAILQLIASVAAFKLAFGLHHAQGMFF